MKKTADDSVLLAKLDSERRAIRELEEQLKALPKESSNDDFEDIVEFDQPVFEVPEGIEIEPLNLDFPKIRKKKTRN